MRRRLALLPLLVAPLAACVLPARGTPVYVDMRAGNFWSGDGMLHEVSEDETRCRVSIRDRSMVVRERWVDCVHVHAKSARHSGTPKRSFK